MTNKLSITAASDWSVDLSEWDTTDPEVIRAGQYLILKDQRKTTEEIAEFFGVKSRTTIWSWVKRWHADGTLEKAIRLYQTPVEEEIRAVHRYTLTRYSEMVKKQIDTAVNGRGMAALAAFAYLKEHVIDPQINFDDVGSEVAKEYAEKSGDLSPLSIPDLVVIAPSPKGKTKGP